jgi:hypothetical protein
MTVNRCRSRQLCRHSESVSRLRATLFALLQSLPEGGSLTIQLAPRAGTARAGMFSLAGLETVRARMAAACKWPHAIAKPND